MTKPIQMEFPFANVKERMRRLVARKYAEDKARRLGITMEELAARILKSRHSPCDPFAPPKTMPISLNVI